jgi:Ca-activated chloride channel family protein
VSGFSVEGLPFLLLLALIPMGWLLMKRQRVRLPYPDPARLAPTRSRPRIWWHAPTVLRSTSLALVAIALVQPVRVWERVESEREGVAIMLAVDISSSMLAEDFRPDNRIEVAKREVIRFVEGRESDWMGLVAFAGEALTMVPGTLDHAVVENSVERLEAGQLRDGTAIGVAISSPNPRSSSSSPMETTTAAASRPRMPPPPRHRSASEYIRSGWGGMASRPSPSPGPRSDTSTPTCGSM